MPVPKYLASYDAFSLNSLVYLATNAEIKTHSYLRAIELYAESAGSIQIDVSYKNIYPFNLKIKIK